MPRSSALHPRADLASPADRAPRAGLAASSVALLVGLALPACGPSGSSDAVIGVDPDASGPAARRQLILLKNLRCDALDSSSFLN